MGGCLHGRGRPLPRPLAGGTRRDQGEAPASPPEHGEVFEEIVSDLDRIILPGITHWQSPRFFGFFPANASGPAILGDLVSWGSGSKGMLWATLSGMHRARDPRPGLDRGDARLALWLPLGHGRRRCDPGFGVERKPGGGAGGTGEGEAGRKTNRIGTGGGLTAYASTQAHSSIEKAVGIAGYGVERLRTIEVDENLSDAARSPRGVDRGRPRRRSRPGVRHRHGGDGLYYRSGPGACHRRGVPPTSCLAPRRCRLFRDHGAAPEMRWINAGLDLADSYCTDPHKWMLTNFDCTAFYVADRAHLVQTLSVLPEYLRNAASESGSVSTTATGRSLSAGGSVPSSCGS